MTHSSSANVESDGDEGKVHTAAEADSSSAESGVEDSRQSEDSFDESEGVLSASYYDQLMISEFWYYEFQQQQQLFSFLIPSVLLLFNSVFVTFSDIAVFVLKRDVKLQLTT